MKREHTQKASGLRLIVHAFVLLRWDSGVTYESHSLILSQQENDSKSFKTVWVREFPVHRPVLKMPVGLWSTKHQLLNRPTWAYKSHIESIIWRNTETSGTWVWDPASNFNNTYDTIVVKWDVHNVLLVSAEPVKVAGCYAWSHTIAHWFNHSSWRQENQFHAYLC